MAKNSAPKKPRPSRKNEATASGSKSSSLKPTPAPAVPARSSLVNWFFRPRQLVITASLGLLWLFAPAVIRYLPQLEDRPEYQVGPEQVTLNPAPRWVPPDLIRQVFERAGFDGTESLLDETLSERVAAAFYTHPWIENVRTVRKSFPPRLYVDVVYREPVAMVKGVDGYYPIDRHSILLPPRDFAAADTQRYPVIERVSSVPLGRLGQSWGDPAVAGAAQLAAVLNAAEDGTESWWKRLDLQAILVPRRVAFAEDLDRLEFQLKTRGGSEILWGRAPGTRHPGELTVAQKLQRLNEYQRDYGSFDDAHGPWEIDIRPWNGIGRGLLAKERADSSVLR